VAPVSIVGLLAVNKAVMPGLDALLRLLRPPII